MPAPAVKFDGALAAAHPHFGSREWSQTGRVLHWRLLRSRWPGVDIISGASLARHTLTSLPDRSSKKACPTRRRDETSHVRGQLRSAHG
jgi:hypothetical protein